MAANQDGGVQLNRTRKCTCCGGQRQYVVIHPVNKDEKATAWAVCDTCDLTAQSVLPRSDKPSPGTPA